MQIDQCLIQVLAQMEQPAFLTKDGIIVHANKHAIDFHFTEGSNVFEICDVSATIYNGPWTTPPEFPVHAGGLYFQAKLSRVGDCILFTLTHTTAKSELKALHLAAIKLKRPLFDLMNTVHDACEESRNMDRAQTNAILKYIYQIHRMVLNMDCASTYRFRNHHPEKTEMRAFLEELVGTIGEKLKTCNVNMEYVPLAQIAVCNLDQAMFTNALLNMITNALDANATQIVVEAKQTDNALRISVTDNGEFLMQELRMNMFNKFLRDPTIYDSFLGIGLGMVIIHATAVAHEGSLMMDCCNVDETRITMSLPLAAPDSNLRQPVHRLFVDRTGGMDPIDVHLSDYLAPEQFSM